MVASNRTSTSVSIVRPASVTAAGLGEPTTARSCTSWAPSSAGHSTSTPVDATIAAAGPSRSMASSSVKSSASGHG